MTPDLSTDSRMRHAQS